MANFTQVDILLVEDNPEDAEVTMRALRKNGLSNNLRWVKDGSKAFTALFGDNGEGGDILVPRLILLDLRLPKIDGLEVARKGQMRSANQEHSRCDDDVVHPGRGRRQELQTRLE